MNGKTIKEMKELYEKIVEFRVAEFDEDHIAEELGIEKESVRMILDSPIVQTRIESLIKEKQKYIAETQEIVANVQTNNLPAMPEIDALTLLDKSQKDAIKTLIYEMNSGEKSGDRIKAATSLLELHRKSNQQNMTQTLMDKTQIEILRKILADYKIFHASKKTLDMPQLKEPQPLLAVIKDVEDNPPLPKSV